MNYHAMEYCELKQEAKAKRIKLYYTMHKALLIQLLSMDRLPEKYIVEKKRIGELRTEARARGFLSVYRLNRSALVELLYPHLYGKPWSENYYKHHNDTYKHHTPKHHNA
uniref:Uncharacterized protein n=1 Tax=viral metagenome TaxID=1070528 RepID=A0A6C0B0N9_9ZZZZ